MDKVLLNLKEYDKVFDECRSIAVKKNNDYGMESLRMFGGQGIFIRMHDKISRLNHLIKQNNNQLVQDESIEDTLKDLINYANYMILIQRNKLEKNPPKRSILIDDFFEKDYM